MARRNPPQNTPLDFTGFKTIYLDFSEKERIEIVQLIADQSIDVLDLMEQSCNDGWKVSVSHSAGWSNYVCSITPKDVPDYPKNCVFMFRHEDFSRIKGFIRFFFTVMVPQGDSRLIGEVSDTSW